MITRWLLVALFLVTYTSASAECVSHDECDEGFYCDSFHDCYDGHYCCYYDDPIDGTCPHACDDTEDICTMCGEDKVCCEWYAEDSHECTFKEDQGSCVKEEGSGSEVLPVVITPVITPDITEYVFGVEGEGEVCDPSKEKGRPMRDWENNLEKCILVAVMDEDCGNFVSYSSSSYHGEGDCTCSVAPNKDCSSRVHRANWTTYEFVHETQPFLSHEDTFNLLLLVLPAVGGFIFCGVLWRVWEGEDVCTAFKGQMRTAVGMEQHQV